MHINTGSEKIDDFIKGYNKNEITLLYGEPSTGKTTIGLLTTIEQAKQNKKVIYIDTEQGFSIERATQLYPEIKKIIENIIVIKPKNFEDQHKYILNLPEKNIALVILDTLGNYYRMELKKDHKEANRKIDEQLQKLKIIITNNIPVLILNQVYNDYNNGTTPVGGQMIKNWCQTIIKLENNPRKIIQEKPEKKELLFTITEKGIE